MGILVLAPADCAANMISRLEGTVCNHGEDVNDIMGEAVNSVENILVVILDFEIAAGHLCDAIINCLVGVDGGFQICMLEEQHSTTRFGILIPGANISEYSNLDVGWDGDGFGEYG